MNMYTQIIEVIRKIQNHMLDVGHVDERLIQALDNAAQKAADLAVIATAENDRGLYELLYGLKSFAATVGVEEFAVVAPAYDVDGHY